jgi:hypothetical protein
MAINIGTSNLSDIRIGTTQVSKVYIGAVQIYPSGYALSFNNINENDFFAQTNNQTVPIASTLHATVSISLGETTIFWEKNGSNTELWNGSSYSDRTLSFNSNDVLSFILVSFSGVTGSLTLRLNNDSGTIVSTFTFALTG